MCASVPKSDENRRLCSGGRDSRLMDQKWHRKEEFWILKIRYLAERKKGAELQQCLRQMKEEQIYLSSKSKEVLAFWLD